MAQTAVPLVGVDVGGTKTHVRVQRGPEVLLDRVVPSATWRTTPALASDENATALLGLLAGLGLGPDAVLAMGAHGVDTRRTADELAGLLGARFPGRVVVVNDAVLVGPAAGFEGTTLAMIVGTGSIVVASSPDGVLAVRGGHGFVLGDEGSAPALVRDLARAVLRAEDEGDPDPVALAHLADCFGVPDGDEREEDLALVMTQRPELAAWGACAPAVFAAADAGSPLAAMVVREHAHALARLVELHLSSGVRPEALVIAGGVAVNQPRLLGEVRRILRRSHPWLRIEVLDAPPVVGAIALAAREAARHAGG